MKKTIILLLIVAVGAVFLTGCETAAQRRGALGGAVIGGAAGGLIGRDVESTAIGAGAGAIGGALLAPGQREHNR